MTRRHRSAELLQRPPQALAADVVGSFEADMTREAAGAFVEMVLRYFSATARRQGPVATSRPYSEITAGFDGPAPKKGCDLSEVVEHLEHVVMRDATRLLHPMYMGHQVGAVLPIGVWSELMVGALNQSLTVVGMSPTATAVERQVVRWMTELARLGPAAGGTFTSGGTEANFTALLAARAHAIPSAWSDGIPPNPPVVVCGEQAHYSITRAIAELGLGSKRVITIPSRNWKMDVDALEDILKKLEKEDQPVMAVVATAGSTPTGSFDDLQAIGSLCQSRGLWMHVDGAHGASALFSQTHSPKLRGVEFAKTLTWDPHKMMLLPLSAGALLARDERDLEAAFTQAAPYVFRDSEQGQIPDQGVRSFMCSRRADALKAWAVLFCHGIDGLGSFYDHLCATTHVLYEQIRDSTTFESVHEPECNILCFRWIGDRSKRPQELNRINAAIHEKYNLSGRGWITSTVLGDRRVLRVTLTNPRTTTDETGELLTGLQEVAHALVQ